MPKYTKKKARSGRFVKGMILYAVIFLVITAAGLAVFWDFIDSYEQSRPQNTVNAYLEGLTAEDMCDGDQELLAQLDANVQTEEQAKQVIRDAVAGELSYAKKSAECTDDRQVYVVRCGSQVIGQIAITAGEPDVYGFRVWSVAEERFDFSWLMSEPVSITVPEDFLVSVNGNVLDESHITQMDIPYGALEEFYGDYMLPTMVTYTADSFLGEAVLAVTDADGNAVEITEETDRNTFLPDCSEAEKTSLHTLVNTFVERYIAFTGSANGAVQSNYNRLAEVLVPDGDLAARLKKAFDGLTYAQSNGDTLLELTMNRYAKLGQGQYLCDFTYIVQTYGRKGAVETTSNMKVIIVETANGLKVEAISSY